MHKYEIAHVLRIIAALLALKGEAVFKVRAYEKAAHSIEHGDFDLELLAREGRLTEIPGIGRNLEPKIDELITTGRSTFLEGLAEEVPMGLLEVVKVPGIGPKTARTLYETLGVTDLDTLEDAVRANLIRTVPRLGARREALIGQGLEEIMKYSGRVTFGLALPAAKYILGMFAGGGVSGSIVGEVRRSLETVSSVEILLETESNAQLVEQSTAKDIGYFSSADLWNKAWSDEEQAFVLASNLGVPLKIHVARASQFAWKQLVLTGPSSFSGWLERLAESKGYVVAEEGLMKGGRAVAAASEADVFKALNITFIPPEVRHNTECRQMALANQAIEPVKLSDIKGDLHVHTTWSDGLASIEQMVKKAVELGYSYIAITDHATRIKIIDGLDPGRIEAQIEEIEKVSVRYPQIRILSGVEVDILKDGSLALPDDTLAKLDIVVASIHQDIGGAGQSVVSRLARAASNPYVDIIGHPTGRLIGRRPGNSKGFHELFKIAAASNTVLEINASPDRLDLSDELARAAEPFGVRFAVCTDAHSVSGMDDMVFGTAASARRAGLTPESVINAQPLETWFPVKGNR